jgi:2-oxoglutarate dehydrogenase E1 component
MPLIASHFVLCWVLIPLFRNAFQWGESKRFGLDGGESLIPGIKAMIDTASDLGVEGVLIGMAHRGRLNMLANVVRKPLESIFQDFMGSKIPEKDSPYTGSGNTPCFGSKQLLP